MLGDAIHAFPPDLGQGVNSALEDVLVLVDALRYKGALPSEGGDLSIDALPEALEAYNTERAPAAEALAKLVQVPQSVTMA